MLCRFTRRRPSSSKTPSTVRPPSTFLLLLRSLGSLAQSTLNALQEPISLEGKSRDSATRGSRTPRPRCLNSGSRNWKEERRQWLLRRGKRRSSCVLRRLLELGITLLLPSTCTVSWERKGGAIENAGADSPYPTQVEATFS